jgi:precorrin-6x reductase
MKLVIFGGTAEGRALIQRHLDEGDEVVACVASEYARKLLPLGARAYTHPMDAEAMAEMLLKEQPDLVIDATHPYAVRVTENIRAAAARTGVRLKRQLRPGGGKKPWAGAVQWVRDAEAAAEALMETRGNILLTTGSHTLATYLTAIPRGRLYARVLPDSGVLKQCEALLMPPGHVVAMQGPFTRAVNAALYDAWDIRILVSKDSGEPGGVTDKVLPALERGIQVIMIQRPGGFVCAENA